MTRQTKLFYHIKGRSLTLDECTELYTALKKHGEKIVFKSIMKTG